MSKKKIQIIRINSERHRVITPIARVSFPQVFTPRAYEDAADQPKSFRVDLIFDSKEVLKEPYKGKKTQTVSIMQALINAKKDQWGEDKTNWPTMQYPVIKDGNERVTDDGEPYDGYADKFFITAKCGEKYPPKIVGIDGRPLTEQEFYGGCYARAVLVARPYYFGKNAGLKMVLMQLMKTSDGEKFGMSGDVFDYSEANALEDDEDESESTDDW
jgi:hypothetical protein